MVTQNTRRAGKKATFLVDMLWVAMLVGSESGTWTKRNDAGSGGKDKKGGNAGKSLSQTGQEPGIWIFLELLRLGKLPLNHIYSFHADV